MSETQEAATRAAQACLGAERYAERLRSLRTIESSRDLNARLHLDHQIRGDALMADAFRQSYTDLADRARVYRADAIRPMGARLVGEAEGFDTQTDGRSEP